MPNITEESTSQFAKVRVDGADMQLHYHDAGTGQPIVMLHGGGPGASGWSNYSRNVDPFVERGFRVILLDLPGFNKSESVTVSGSRGLQCAQALKGLMDQLDISTAHMVGNSLGGITSMHFAMEYPDRIGKQVLMGPGGLGSSLFQVVPMEGIRQLFTVYRNPTKDNLRKLIEVFIYDQSKITDDLIDVRYQAMVINLTHLRNFVDSFEKYPASLLEDLTSRLGKVAAETLVIWGRDDRFVPLDHAMKLLWALPNAQLQMFGKCGHWVQWEKSAEFNRAVLSFLTAA